MQKRVETTPAPPDFSAYRSRAAKWLDDWSQVPPLDWTAQREFLMLLLRNLSELIADLKSVAAPAAEIEPLEHLCKALVTALTSSTLRDEDWNALCEQMEQTCAAFAQVRPAFWK